MATATEPKPRQRRSFKTQLMLLVALAVVLPALFTCLILGTQLNRQARNLFANGLAANLETFALVLQDAERNVSEGLARMAADNTLQVTLDLEMKSQLNKYLEAQRQVLGMSFVGVFNAESRVVAFSGAETETARWRFAGRGEAPGAGCAVSRDQTEQLVDCDGALYLVAMAAVIKIRDASLGDAGQNQGSQLLGSIIGGLPVANSGLIGELLSRRVLHPLIWAAGKLVYSNLPANETPFPASLDGVADEYDLGETAYLGVAKTLRIGAQTLDYGLVMPLDPLRETLRRSLLTVAGIGLLVVIATMIAISLAATRLLRPIEQLRQGAARIGGGDLAQRIAVTSGDEFEALADQFNDMAGRLQESYADLENKVELRTRELTESLEQQTATAEVLRVISSSPGTLEPVFQSMLANATRLCGAKFAILYLREGEAFRLTAMHDVPAEFAAERAKEPLLALQPGTVLSRMVDSRGVVQIEDITAQPGYLNRNPLFVSAVELHGADE